MKTLEDWKKKFIPTFQTSFCIRMLTA